MKPGPTKPFYSLQLFTQTLAEVLIWFRLNPTAIDAGRSCATYLH